MDTWQDRVVKTEPTDDTDPYIPLWWEAKIIYALRGKA